jgi:hypothetical protein
MVKQGFWVTCPKQTILTSLLARVHLSDLFHKTVVSAAHVTVGPGVASIAIKMLSVCRGFE